jgi:hypothetical protein
VRSFSYSLTLSRRGHRVKRKRPPSKGFRRLSCSCLQYIVIQKIYIGASRSTGQLLPGDAISKSDPKGALDAQSLTSPKAGLLCTPRCTAACTGPLRLGEEGRNIQHRRKSAHGWDPETGRNHRKGRKGTLAKGGRNPERCQQALSMSV